MVSGGISVENHNQSTGKAPNDSSSLKSFGFIDPVYGKCEEGHITSDIIPNGHVSVKPFQVFQPFQWARNLTFAHPVPL